MIIAMWNYFHNRHHIAIILFFEKVVMKMYLNYGK